MLHRRRWQSFVHFKRLPTLGLAAAASAVYSARTDGSAVDLNAFMRSKERGRPARKGSDQEGVEDLERAYEFARARVPSRTNVEEEMDGFFDALEALRGRDLGVEAGFYHAALLHLVLAKIHPFDDGNGRIARLLEKWFLAELRCTASPLCAERTSSPDRTTAPA